MPEWPGGVVCAFPFAPRGDPGHRLNELFVRLTFIQDSRELMAQTKHQLSHRISGHSGTLRIPELTGSRIRISHVSLPIESTSVHILPGIILKPGVFAKECQATGSNRTITLFADNHLGSTFILAVFVINLVTVNEEDHVRILLDGA